MPPLLLSLAFSRLSLSLADPNYAAMDGIGSDMEASPVSDDMDSDYQQEKGRRGRTAIAPESVRLAALAMPWMLGCVFL